MARRLGLRALLTSGDVDAISDSYMNCCWSCIRRCIGVLRSVGRQLVWFNCCENQGFRKITLTERELQEMIELEVNRRVEIELSRRLQVRTYHVVQSADDCGQVRRALGKGRRFRFTTAKSTKHLQVDMQRNNFDGTPSVTFTTNQDAYDAAQRNWLDRKSKSHARHDGYGESRRKSNSRSRDRNEDVDDDNRFDFHDVYDDYNNGGGVIVAERPRTQIDFSHL